MEVKEGTRVKIVDAPGHILALVLKDLPQPITGTVTRKSGVIEENGLWWVEVDGDGDIEVVAHEAQLEPA